MHSAPSVGAKVPAGHAEHDAVPLTAVDEPAGHAVHAAAPAALYVPALQFVGAAAPASLYVPAVTLMHAAADDEPAFGLYVPLAHGWHTLLFAAGCVDDHVPGGQRV